MTEPWWRDAVVYQVYPRSFADADSSGEGDLQGIRLRLPYIADLGFDAIWLTPFYPSPMRDGGYDIADYFDVDQRFGTLDDFDQLVEDATHVGIRVIIDVVPNHCSSEHRWFQEALNSAPGSEARDRFIFRDSPNNWKSHFGGPAWTETQDGQWYLHLFDSSQPDFNWRNAAVVNLFERVLRFWLDRGVAGIRVDMANTLFKESSLPDLVEDSRVLPYYNQPELHYVYRSWRRILDSYDSDAFPGRRMAVGEVWYEDPESVRVFLTQDGLSQIFNFRLMLVPWDARHIRKVVEETIGLVSSSDGSMPWVLGNHDIMRLASRLGMDQSLIQHPTDDARRGAVNIDISLGARRAKAAALLLLALPGSAYVYQGDELGLTEYFEIPADRRMDPTFFRTNGLAIGRDGCRVPLPWSGTEPPYGFSERGVRTWLPQPADWAELSVRAELCNSDSTLNLYRMALRLRRVWPALGAGDLTFLDRNPDVLAFTREPGFEFLANLGERPIDLPPNARVILASGPVEGRQVPTDTAVWLGS